MGMKLFFWGLWFGFIAYASVLAPPNQPDTFLLIQKLSTGEWQGINPLVISLFNLMGVWPMIYSCVLFIDGRGQKISAGLFAIASFGVGAFALLPYLGLRQPNPHFVGDKNFFIKILDSRITGVLLSLGALSLVLYGVGAGDWHDFVMQWQTSRFIHVMSLDFCLLCLLFPALVKDDLTRRGMNNSNLFLLLTFIPLLGPLIYLSLRSPLDASQVHPSHSSQQPTA